MNTQQDPHSRQSLVSTEWSISAMEVKGAVADSFPSSELYFKYRTERIKINGCGDTEW